MCSFNAQNISFLNYIMNQHIQTKTNKLLYIYILELLQGKIRKGEKENRMGKMVGLRQ